MSAGRERCEQPGQRRAGSSSSRAGKQAPGQPLLGTGHAAMLHSYAAWQQRASSSQQGRRTQTSLPCLSCSRKRQSFWCCRARERVARVVGRRPTTEMLHRHPQKAWDRGFQHKAALNCRVAAAAAVARARCPAAASKAALPCQGLCRTFRCSWPDF